MLLRGQLTKMLLLHTLISTGIIENNPLYSWYKSNDENISIVSSVTSSKPTI